MEGLEKVEGNVLEIVYENPKNGYTVCEIDSFGDLHICLLIICSSYRLSWFVLSLYEWINFMIIS